MSYFMVFSGKRRPKGFMGESYIDWNQPIIGVYKAEDADEAFRAAAKDNDGFGSFFAVEGKAVGIHELESDASQFGRSDSPIQRLNKTMERLEANERKLQELAAQGNLAELPEGEYTKED